MKLIRDMEFNEIVDWATGTLILSIGQGKFKETVYMVLSSVVFELKKKEEIQKRKK